MTPIELLNLSNALVAAGEPARAGRYKALALAALDELDAPPGKRQCAFADATGAVTLVDVKADGSAEAP